MALFNAPPAAPTPQDIVRAALVAPLDSQHQTMLSWYTIGMDLAWNGKIGQGSHENGGYTIQEVMEYLSTDAVAFIELAAAFRDFINTVIPGSLSTDTPLPLIPNQDGTVTVGSL